MPKTPWSAWLSQGKKKNSTRCHRRCHNQVHNDSVLLNIGYPLALPVTIVQAILKKDREFPLRKSIASAAPAAVRSENAPADYISDGLREYESAKIRK